VRFQSSEQGVTQASKGYELLIETIKAEVEAIRSNNSGVEINVKSTYGIELVYGLGPAMTLFWQCHYSNTLDGASLKVEIHSGVPRLPGLMPPFEPPQLLKTFTLAFELTALDKTAYIEQSTKREFQPEALANFLLTTYMDYAEKHKRRR